MMRGSAAYRTIEAIFLGLDYAVVKISWPTQRNVTTSLKGKEAPVIRQLIRPPHEYSQRVERPDLSAKPQL